MTFFRILLLVVAALCASHSVPATAQGPRPVPVYDMEAARKWCDTAPLDHTEGIWEYPDDHVRVLVRRAQDAHHTQFPSYDIIAITSEDCRINPGETIGTLSSTAKDGVYEITLFTERRGDSLMSPHSCTATLSANHRSLLLKKERSRFRLRINTGISRLLPGFWNLLRVAASGSISTGSEHSSTPAGMVKAYPSYDGNGSDYRTPRYL